MGTTNFDIVQANAFIGVDIDSNVFGNTWYVATTGADGNDGKSPQTPFLTIGQAITKGAAGDNIIIGPGTYTITSALVPLARMLFKAAIIDPRAPTVVITGNIADLVQVDVSGVRFVGLEFKASGATADNLIDVADTAAVAGMLCYACVFNGNDQTSVVGINNADASTAGTQLRIIDCLFRDLTGTALNVGALGFAYSMVRDCQFAIDANSATGISLADTTAFDTGKGYVIKNNDFTGFDATGNEVGITLAGTENATGAGIIRNNYFAYVGVGGGAITIDILSPSEVNNYAGDAATGGTLVDPGT